VKVPPESTPIRHAIYPCHSAGDPVPIIMGQSRLAQSGGTGETAILRDALSGPA